MRQGIKEKDIRDFEKYAQKLSNVMERIREYKPDANAYLSCETLNLISCNVNELDTISEQQDYVVADILMKGFDAGDW